MYKKRLEELKKEITSFMKDYKIATFEVYIDIYGDFKFNIIEEEK